MLKKKILLVDDDQNIRLLIAQALGKKYRVFEAADGDRAIEDARKLRPDLILLDLMLPGKDGIEICRRFKDAPETQKIKIIMLTAKKCAIVESAALAYGADYFMTKPFKMAALKAKIGELIG